MPIIAAPLIPVGELQISWIDPTGIVRALSQNPYVNAMPDMRGWGYVGTALAQDKLPFSPGTILRHVQLAPDGREIELPLHVSGSTPAEIQQLMDQLYQWFSTANERSRTPGYLQVVRRDGTGRQIAGYYVGGLEGDLADDVAGETWQDVTITLKAPDPMPTGLVDVTATYTQDDLGDNLIVGNDGDEEAYPIWTIIGPASAITLTLANASPVKTIALTADGGLTVAAGETLTIDTRPTELRFRPQIYDGDGASQFSHVADGGDLQSWLRPGTNRIVLGATSTSAATQFRLRFRPRYKGFYR